LVQLFGYSQIHSRPLFFSGSCLGSSSSRETPILLARACIRIRKKWLERVVAWKKLLWSSSSSSGGGVLQARFVCLCVKRQH
jgi:hypothetical protein